MALFHKSPKKKREHKRGKKNARPTKDKAQQQTLPRSQAKWNPTKDKAQHN